MITSLYIRNLAIIKELHVNFRSGLNIITGETGAGKSVIINAISLLLGARFSRDHIRTGAEKTIIEGIFETDSNKPVIIRRIFSIGGKSRIFINDEPAKLNDLHAFTEKRIDMHGQHDHQRLLNSQNHLDYLDSFGDYGDVIDNVSDLFFKLKHAQETLGTLVKQKDDMDEKRELYSFQMTEIEKFPIAK